MAKPLLKTKKNKWITSAASRKDSQHYRAISDLIITGSGTIINDDPLLNVRSNKIVKSKVLINLIKPLSQAQIMI